MPFDQYSPCPCGSGKKLKFCKCVEQPQEYEKLIRLIEGGQELAAMDRINQMLSKTPSAAWLLALKAELALDLNEFETFNETVNRFLKLRPDNPLALVMKALASLLSMEPVENAAGYLLGGLAESRDALPALTPMAIDLLIAHLNNSNQLSLAGYWAELRSMISHNRRKAADPVLQDELLNLVAKVSPPLVTAPPNAPWKERLAEVISLSSIFSFAQAETKLRAILRDFPDQPAPLSHLLQAQMAQLNQGGAYATALKLANHPEIPSSDRAYYFALALELEPAHQSIRPMVATHYAEVDSLEPIIERLSGLTYVQPIPEGEYADNFKALYAAAVKDELPAKLVYTIFDRPATSPQPDSPQADTATSDPALAEAAAPTIANSIGSLGLFGKQTDKPARILLGTTQFAPHQSRIDELLEVLQLGPKLQQPDFVEYETYVDFLTRLRLVVGTIERPSIEQHGALVIEEFLNLPLPLFDGATPLEAAKEERYRGALAGLLSHFEGEQSLIVPQNTIDEIYRRLELDRPTAEAVSDADKVKVVNILNLDRFNPSKLSDDDLPGCMMRAFTYSASRAVHHYAREILSRESLANDAHLQLMARGALRMTAVSVAEKIEHGKAMVPILSSIGAPVGQVVVELITLLSIAGREEEARQILSDAFAAHPDDPHLTHFIQSLTQLRSNAGPAPDSDELAQRMLQRAARTEQGSSPGSGLVLPGQEPAAAQRESKLWLPGS